MTRVTPGAEWAPNAVALLRILLAFMAIGLFSLSAIPAALALVLTVVVITMDSLDGYLARKLGVASELGALIDITADRIVEHVFWIYFAVAGQVGVWVPMIVVTRSFLVDTVRSIAFSQGKTPFGEDTMMRSGVTQFLVASRFSRAVYGISKVVVFVLIGAQIALEKADAAGLVSTPPYALEVLGFCTHFLVVLTVALNLIRGLPVLWDSKQYLLSKTYPKELRDER